MFNSLAISRRYSRALFEVALGQKKLDVVLRDFSILSKLLQDLKVQAFFKKMTSFNCYFDEFTQIIQSVDYKFCDLTLNLIKVMLENERLALLSYVAEDFFIRVHKFEKREKVVIETAYVLDDSYRQQFIKKITSDLGDNFFFEFRENKDYIDGYRISFRSKIIDATVKNRIELLTRGIRV